MSLSHHGRLAERVGFQFGSGMATLTHHKRSKPGFCSILQGSLQLYGSKTIGVVWKVHRSVELKEYICTVPFPHGDGLKDNYAEHTVRRENLHVCLSAKPCQRQCAVKKHCLAFASRDVAKHSQKDFPRHPPLRRQVKYHVRERISTSEASSLSFWEQI